MKILDFIHSFNRKQRKLLLILTAINIVSAIIGYLFGIQKVVVFYTAIILGSFLRFLVLGLSESLGDLKVFDVASINISHLIVYAGFTYIMLSFILEMSGVHGVAYIIDYIILMFLNFYWGFLFVWLGMNKGDNND